MAGMKIGPRLSPSPCGHGWTKGSPHRFASNGTAGFAQGMSAVQRSTEYLLMWVSNVINHPNF